MKAKIAENAKSLYVLFLKWQDPPQSNLAAFAIEMDMASCQLGHSPLGLDFFACRGTYPKGQPAISK
jgi:hypothetical protein